MIILQIEHSINDFGEWKKLFDSDPADRAGSGVKKHRLSQPVDNPNSVNIELTFDDRESAEAMHEKLKGVWSNMAGEIFTDPKARIIEVVEETEY